MFPNLNTGTRMCVGSENLICKYKGGMHHKEWPSGISIQKQLQRQEEDQE